MMFLATPNFIVHVTDDEIGSQILRLLLFDVHLTGYVFKCCISHKDKVAKIHRRLPRIVCLFWDVPLQPQSKVSSEHIVGCQRVSVNRRLIDGSIFSVYDCIHESIQGSQMSVLARPRDRAVQLDSVP